MASRNSSRIRCWLFLVGALAAIPLTYACSRESNVEQFAITLDGKTVKPTVLYSTNVFGGLHTNEKRVMWLEYDRQRKRYEVNIIDLINPRARTRMPVPFTDLDQPSYALGPDGTIYVESCARGDLAHRGKRYWKLSLRASPEDITRKLWGETALPCGRQFMVDRDGDFYALTVEGLARTTLDGTPVVLVAKEQLEKDGALKSLNIIGVDRSDTVYFAKGFRDVKIIYKVIPTGHVQPLPIPSEYFFLSAAAVRASGEIVASGHVLFGANALLIIKEDGTARKLAEAPSGHRFAEVADTNSNAILVVVTRDPDSPFAHAKTWLLAYELPESVD